MEERLRSHYESLSRVIGWTRVADAKAAPILALHTALLGTASGNAAAIRHALEQGSVPEKAGLAFLLTVFLASVAVAVVLAARVYVPQTRPAGSSSIYFGSIAQSSFDEFSAQAKLRDEAQIEDDLLEQIYVVSRIAFRKMEWVRSAFFASGPAIISWVGLLAVSS